MQRPLVKWHLKEARVGPSSEPQYLSVIRNIPRLALDQPCTFVVLWIIYSNAGAIRWTVPVEIWEVAVQNHWPVTPADLEKAVDLLASRRLVLCRLTDVGTCFFLNVAEWLK